jgi:FtsZ-binding cell division protein ZapB
MAKKKPEQMVFNPGEENDVLARLGERIEKAIASIQQLRRERDELRHKLARAEEDLRNGNTGGNVAELQEALERMQSERDEVRGRLSKLLANLDRLEEA